MRPSWLVAVPLLLACAPSPARVASSPPASPDNDAGLVTQVPPQDAGTSGAGPFRLTVFLAGYGSGEVQSDPPGIDCPRVCDAPFSAGTKVTLKVTAAPGSVAAIVSGACGADPGGCLIPLDRDQWATVRFDAPPPASGHYSIREIPQPAKDSLGQPAAINSRGDVVGNFLDNSGSGSERGAFIYEAGDGGLASDRGRRQAPQSKRGRHQ